MQTDSLFDASDEIVRAEDLRKTFTLSRKQQRLERAAFSRKVAVDGLSRFGRRICVRAFSDA